MTQQQPAHPAKPEQRMHHARVVRMERKAVFWAVLCASLLALMTFSLLFIHAAYRNSWW